MPQPTGPARGQRHTMRITTSTPADTMRIQAACRSRAHQRLSVPQPITGTKSYLPGVKRSKTTDANRSTLVAWQDCR